MPGTPRQIKPSSDQQHAGAGLQRDRIERAGTERAPHRRGGVDEGRHRADWNSIAAGADVVQIDEPSMQARPSGYPVLPKLRGCGMKDLPCEVAVGQLQVMTSG